MRPSGSVLVSGLRLTSLRLSGLRLSGVRVVVAGLVAVLVAGLAVVVVVPLGSGPAVAADEAGSLGGAVLASPAVVGGSGVEGLDYADPGSGVGLVAPPVASSTGSARVSYPLGVPAGRGGVGPVLGLVYDSAGVGAGSGWLGAGWSLSGVGEVSVDTGFGVPLFCPRRSGPVCGDLKRVTNPLGGSFDLDYTRAGNTTDHPGSLWTMTRLTIDDGYAADGPAMTTTYTYDRLRYDFLHRTSLGFATLTTRRARHPPHAGTAGAGHPGDLHQHHPLQRRPAPETRVTDPTDPSTGSPVGA